MKRTSAHYLLACVLFVILSCGTIIFISYSIVNRFIFRALPNTTRNLKTQHYRTMLIEQHGAQPVMLRTSDELTLSGLLILRDNATRTLIMCHGYSRNKEHMHRLVSLFAHENILLFDHRAHGESQGTMTTIGFYERNDVHAAVSYLQSHPLLKHMPIYGLGFSMGAVALLGAAAQGAPFQAIILDSAFKQLDEQISFMFSEKTRLPQFPFMCICRLLFEYFCDCSMAEVDTLAWAQHVTIPTLIIHASGDLTTPCTVAQQLYDSCHGIKSLWVPEYACHAHSYKKCPEEYATKVLTFFENSEK